MYDDFFVTSECDDALREESRKMTHDNKDDDEIEDKQGESKKRARLSERSKKIYGGRTEINTVKKGRDVKGIIEGTTEAANECQ